MVYRYTHIVRSTGAHVTLVDNRSEGFDVGGGPWITYCEDHGNYCEHDTRRLAESFVSVPEEWCPDCRGICEKRALAQHAEHHVRNTTHEATLSP